MASSTSEKILGRLKGLRAQMRAGEQPLFSIPAIWENATAHQSNACDLVLTNQRLFGYIYTTFPRPRLFLDDLELPAVTTVSIRSKSFEAMFRELLVSDNRKRIYIRATSKKIEETYSALRAAIDEHASLTADTLAASSQADQPGKEQSLFPQSVAPSSTSQTVLAGSRSQSSAGPTYSRQRIRQPLERSPLGITLLLAGGLILEILGVLAWAIIDNAQAGIPLILTGIFAVIVATFARRQKR
ncbi:MAG TPA: hypothetical protein VGD98_22250 [Ktedonobacteraceae bacterium]